MFRRRRSASSIPDTGPASAPVGDVTTVPPSYRPAVTRALQAREQFAEVVASVGESTTGARLAELGARIDVALAAIWGAATQLATVDRVTSALDVERITAELKQARRDQLPAEVIEALQARFRSTQQLLNDRDERHQSLDVLSAQLDTAVVHATIVAATRPSVGGFEEVAVELDEVVVKLDALARANRELQ